MGWGVLSCSFWEGGGGYGVKPRSLDDTEINPCSWGHVTNCFTEKHICNEL